MKVQIEKYNLWLTVKDPSGSTLSVGVNMLPEEEGELIVEFPGESPMTPETLGLAMVDTFNSLMPTCKAFTVGAPTGFIPKEDSF